MHAKSSCAKAPIQITGIRPGTTRFPRYDAAELGFDGYWWPVMFSDALPNRRPVTLRLFGNDIMFFREKGTAYALADRCPHRGVPISAGKQEFDGTFTCGYHGWTFDLATGKLVAALTDGPDSPICGKAAARTYPVAERAGLIWLFQGEGIPPAPESHIPAEFLGSDAVVEGRISQRPGDWRYAAENGLDDGHAKYLHRDSLFLLFRRIPGSTLVDVVAGDDGWVKLVGKTARMQSEYPGLGTWPKTPPWKRRAPGPGIAFRLPGVLRVDYRSWIHFEWYLPTDPGEHRYLQFAVKRAKGWDALLFRAKYQLFLRWIFHGLFNDQDARMVELMSTPPEQLYRPDNSLIGWRRLCEEQGGSDLSHEVEAWREPTGVN